MLDADLARLYGVTTSNLNKAVKRNNNRFPADFVFQLTAEEAGALRFQSGTSNASRRGGRRYLPYVFTEQGVAILSSVLRSNRAVEVNIEIMRAFVYLRRFLSTHKELAQKLAQLVYCLTLLVLYRAYLTTEVTKSTEEENNLLNSGRLPNLALRSSCPPCAPW
jgi:hypothetical protein